MADDYECPRGCGQYQRLSRHWSGSNCDFPALDEIQRETVEGLLLAGASIAGNGPNKHLTIGTTSEPLAGWTARELDWLHHGTRRETFDGERNDVHRVRTHSHATLSRYRGWFDDGERRPPTDLDPAAHTARVWYAYAGGLQWHGSYDSQRAAVFSALDDGRADWIRTILETAGFDATRAGTRVQLPPTEARAFLAWIGTPVPGAEHKWAETRDRHQTLRS